PTLPGSEPLLRLRRRLTRRNPAAVALPLAEVPGSDSAVPTVRGGAEPQKWRTGAIGSVVSRTAAGPGEIGDLVVLEPTTGQESVREQVLLRGRSIVGRGDLAAQGPLGQGGVGLHCETVEREMFGFERYCLVQVRAPIAVEHRWQTVDEIERDVGEPRVAQHPHRVLDLLRPVGAMHPPEHVRVERLRAQGDTVDPRACPGRIAV